MAVRALIVEGSRSIRNAIRFHLECVGCDVVAEVGTGMQALQLVRTVKPDVVTLDLDAPCPDETDPLRLFREIRAEAPETRILLLSRDAYSADGEDFFLRQGALGCIVGPFGSESFELLWRRLSEVYPELMDYGFAAKLSHPLSSLSISQNRQMA